MNSHDVYKSLSPLLRPLSLPYALLMAKRRKLYERGVLPSFIPQCPCVAVGNIAWGGTGKTPFAAWLLDWAGQRGLKAVVLTRGYGGNPGKKPLLVRAGTGAEQAGDEPLMLAQSFPEASVLVYPKRSESARYAHNHLDPDLLILDDGMQHLGMGRHADIVLLRPEDLEGGWDRVIPSGSWREGASALSAATVFAIKADAEELARLAPVAEKRLSAFGKGLFSFTLVPSGLRRLLNKDAHHHTSGRAPECPPCAEAGQAAEHSQDRRAQEDSPLHIPEQEYHDRPYILVSGVGDPTLVEESATRVMGRPPLQHFDFEDHHPYSAADVQAIVKLSAAPLPVVCTAKDAVKLQEFREDWGNTPVWVMETELRFGPSLFSDHSFPQWWQNWWDTRRGQRAGEKGE